ncbi:hypothetical protein DPM19_20020 [Actinomadura craniellae]|uniref:Uncharacterized protein n=1 Tax=Actinomadura craniellae TaxID=2231787 RepID=A0A365H2Z7_9ACTN|nr:hypothetical protein DPM19_20020 [Actinomadura craniellae]
MPDTALGRRYGRPGAFRKGRPGTGHRTRRAVAVPRGGAWSRIGAADLPEKWIGLESFALFVVTESNQMRANSR